MQANRVVGYLKLQKIQNAAKNPSLTFTVELGFTSSKPFNARVQQLSCPMLIAWKAALKSDEAIDRKERKLNCLFYHKMCLKAAHILTPREQGDVWPNGGTFCAQLSAFASVDDLKRQSLLHFFK